MNQFEAARVGNLEWFSNNEFDINAQDSNGDTVLILASWKGHTEIAFAIIEKGANLDLQDNWGTTALTCASGHGHTEIAFALIEKGANLDLQNKCGGTALTRASWNGHTEITDAIESWKQTPRSLKYTIQMYIKKCNIDTSSVPHGLLQMNPLGKEINMGQEF